MTAKNITVALTRKEALVLFEWLARIDSKGGSLFDHPSEEKVLWNIEGQLESVLTEPFAENYKELLADARKSVETDP